MTACSEMLFVELGVYSIKTYVLIKQYNFWKKIEDLDNSDPLKYAITLGKRYKLKEVQHYEHLLEKYTNADEIVSEFYEKIKTDIRTKAEQK